MKRSREKERKRRLRKKSPPQMKKLRQLIQKVKDQLRMAEQGT